MTKKKHSFLCFFLTTEHSDFALFSFFFHLFAAPFSILCHCFVNTFICVFFVERAFFFVRTFVTFSHFFLSFSVCFGVPLSLSVTIVYHKINPDAIGKFTKLLLSFLYSLSILGIRVLSINYSLFVHILLIVCSHLVRLVDDNKGAPFSAPLLFHRLLLWLSLGR